MRYTPRVIDDLESRRSSATIPPVRVHFRREQAADSWHLREPLPFTDANGVKGEGIDEHKRLLRAGNKLSLPESLGSRSFFTGLFLSLSLCHCCASGRNKRRGDEDEYEAA